MNKVICITLFLTVFTVLKSQKYETKDLYFSTKQFNVTALHILSEEYALAESQSQIYLLNKERQITDTINKIEKPVQEITITGENKFSVLFLNSLQYYEIKNDKFQLLKGIAISKNIYHKQIKDSVFIHYALDPNNLVINTLFINDSLMVGFKRKNDKNIFTATYLNNNKIIEITEAPEKLILKKTYEKELVTKMYYHDNKVYINYTKANACYVYDFEKKEKQYFSFPPPEKKEKASWYYMYDYIGKTNYLVKYFRNKTKEIYKLDFNTLKLEFVTSFKHSFESIVNGKIHVISVFEGKLAHYLIPVENYSDETKSYVIPEIKISDK